MNKQKILIVTEYYNELEHIEGLIHTVMRQTVKPDMWLLIDDGSFDPSSSYFTLQLEKHGMPYVIEKMPMKKKPDVNKKGVAFQQSRYLMKNSVDHLPYDWLLKIDADTRLPRDYIEIMLEILESNPDVSVLSTQVVNESKRKFPCGTGKFVRWDIIRLTAGNYWDLDPDTLWNLYALVNKHKIKIIDGVMNVNVVRPTFLNNEQGRYTMGRRLAYVRCNTLLVAFRFFKSLKQRTHAWQFLKGYLKEWLRIRNRWRCRDKTVNYFYSLRYQWHKRRGVYK